MGYVGQDSRRLLITLVIVGSIMGTVAYLEYRNTWLGNFITLPESSVTPKVPIEPSTGVLQSD